MDAINLNGYHYLFRWIIIQVLKLKQEYRFLSKENIPPNYVHLGFSESGFRTYENLPNSLLFLCMTLICTGISNADYVQ